MQTRTVPSACHPSARGLSGGMEANAAVHSSGVVTSVVRGEDAYSRDGAAQKSKMQKRGPLRPVVTAVKYKVTTCRIVRKKAARDAKRSHDTRCPHGHPLGLAALGHPSTRAHIGAFSTKTEMEGWLEREFNSLPPFPDES